MPAWSRKAGRSAGLQRSRRQSAEAAVPRKPSDPACDRPVPPTICGAHRERAAGVAASSQGSEWTQTHQNLTQMHQGHSATKQSTSLHNAPPAADPGPHPRRTSQSRAMSSGVANLAAQGPAWPTMFSIVFTT